MRLLSVTNTKIRTHTHYMRFSGIAEQQQKFGLLCRNDDNKSAYN